MYSEYRLSILVSSVSLIDENKNTLKLTNETNRVLRKGKVFSAHWLIDDRFPPDV